MGMSVVVATAYMEEAERFDWLIAMNAGQGPGGWITRGTQAAAIRQRRVEEAFIALLPAEQRRGHKVLQIPPRRVLNTAPVIVAHDLTCRFGDFTAVDQVNFTIERGEIFGFLGSNGCGKTTTMKMLTGLAAGHRGRGASVRPAGRCRRHRNTHVGSATCRKSFSLYTELTVRQNLDLHAHLFHLPRDKAKARIAELVDRFGLAKYLDQRTLDLPLGIRQRLSLAVAIVHAPEILILDEPTSGVDPLERDRFWELLIDLSRNQGVTIFVSTHFMNEAERCDRISLMDAGRVLATDTPAGLVKARGVSTLEEAFISYLEEATRAARPRPGSRRHPTSTVACAQQLGTGVEVARGSVRNGLLAYSIREGLELLRDPIRLGFGLFGTALLMLVFGFGVSTDVNNLTFAVLDRDQTPESRAYLEELRGSTYFIEKPPIADYARSSRSGSRTATWRPASKSRPASAATSSAAGRYGSRRTVDGAMPFRAQTIRGYLQAMHQLYLTDPAVKTTVPSPPPPADIEVRFKYNQDFDSIYAMVPANLSP